MQQIYLKPANIIQPFFPNSNIFRRKPIVLLEKCQRWRKTADIINLSAKARLRLEWIIFYYKVANENAYQTAEHFGITPKTFYKWLNRFNNGRQKVKDLEEQSRAPINTRDWEVTQTEEIRIIKLRRKYIHWGKKKLKRLYFREYSKTISTWKIERVIRKHKLYPNPVKAEKLATKRKEGKIKKRITNLVLKPELWFLIHLDTIVIYWGNLKRYILTAVDHQGKFGYARMYKTKSSRVAKDFLYRLHYLLQESIPNVQTDEGSEFKGEFDQALEELKTTHWFSRVRVPQDNSEAERFNQTLEYEWLYDSNFTPDCNKFNKALTEWLIEYNFIRPHESLDYLTPIEYIEDTLVKQQILLPMWSARTKH